MLLSICVTPCFWLLWCLDLTSCYIDVTTDNVGDGERDSRYEGIFSEFDFLHKKTGLGFI